MTEQEKTFVEEFKAIKNPKAVKELIEAAKEVETTFLIANTPLEIQMALKRLRLAIFKCEENA